MDDKPKNARRPGPRPLPKDLLRVVLKARVRPATLRYLEGMGFENCGRALDCLVDTAQDQGIKIRRFGAAA